MKRLSIAATLLLACGGHRGETTKALPDFETVPAINPSVTLATTSEELTIPLGSRTLGGTLVRPERGTWPGVLLVAGSGPTDRNWESPLLAGKNGSGRQLAEAIAAHGAVVLRYDKAGTGTSPLPAKIDFDTHLEETRAALTALRARPEVDPKQIFIVGNSEGGIWATRTAQAEPANVTGLIYLSAASRSVEAILIEQVRTNLLDVAKMPSGDVDKIAAAMHQAFDDALAGKPVDVTKISDIPQLQQLMAKFFAPQLRALALPLAMFENASEAAKLPHPRLVMAGGKDMQVDPERDGRLMERNARAAGREVTYHLSPEANHVYKHEARTVEELKKDPQGAIDVYARDGVPLDTDAVDAILTWLAAHSGAHRPR
jgi:pimeloyl-ACP methyl ester carboxylesterase